MLDLFVNNERTLLKIYEILFSQPNFKQSQILANPSDSIRLNDTSHKNFKLLDSSLFTQPTQDLSIDQTSDAVAAAFNTHSPSPYDMQNSSFVLDELNQDSQMVTEMGEQIPDLNAKQGGTQMSGGLKISTLNHQSTTLPNILPAIN